MNLFMCIQQPSSLLLPRRTRSAGTASSNFNRIKSPTHTSCVKVHYTCKLGGKSDVGLIQIRAKRKITSMAILSKNKCKTAYQNFANA